MQIEFEPLLWSLSETYRESLKDKMQALSENAKTGKYDKKIDAIKTFFFTEDVDNDYDLSCFVEDCVYEWTNLHTEGKGKCKCTFQYSDRGGDYVCSTKRLFPLVKDNFAMLEGKKGYELVLERDKGRTRSVFGCIDDDDPYYTVEVVMRRKGEGNSEK